jgi:hypothetical protein
MWIDRAPKDNFRANFRSIFRANSHNTFRANFRANLELTSEPLFVYE